jgi:hypothetical protein
VAKISINIKETKDFHANFRHFPRDQVAKISINIKETKDFYANFRHFPCDYSDINIHVSALHL